MQILNENGSLGFRFLYYKTFDIYLPYNKQSEFFKPIDKYGKSVYNIYIIVM